MRQVLKTFIRLYGANPLHLLAFLASFALAGYASTALFHRMTIRVAVWFIGAAVLHDMLLLPLYGLANLSLVGIWRLAPGEKTVPWLNYVRFPAVISGTLLLIYYPEISRRRTAQFSNSGLSNHVYLGHWLLVTGILFGLSAVAYAVRLGRMVRANASQGPARSGGGATATAP